MAGDSDVLSLIADAARSGAERLEINDQRLEALPAEIGSLHHLKSLAVRRCGLKSLPPEIWNLRKLRHLYLAENKLVAVPPEIGKLEELSSLDLSFNQLTFLPSEIKRLKRLWSIVLSGNGFTEFPNLPTGGGSRVGFSVHLSYNQIREIPSRVGELNIHYLERGEQFHLHRRPGDCQTLTAREFDSRQ